MNTGMPRNVFIMKSSQRTEHSVGSMSVSPARKDSVVCVWLWAAGDWAGIIADEIWLSGHKPFQSLLLNVFPLLLLLVFFLQASCQYHLRSMGLWVSLFCRLLCAPWRHCEGDLGVLLLSCIGVTPSGVASYQAVPPLSSCSSSTSGFYSEERNIT